MLQNLLFKKPSSGGVIATLTMVAGGNPTGLFSSPTRFGYRNWYGNDNYGTLNPDSFEYNGLKITIRELYYENSISIRMQYTFGYESATDPDDYKFSNPRTITIRIGDTVLICSGQTNYITDSIYTFESGETYTIEILSVTF